MAEERIDIEVNDRVAASIPTKLRDIAAHAEKGESALTRLRSALSALPTAKLAALSRGASTSSSQLAALTGAVAALDARLATIASAAAQTESSLDRLGAAAAAAGTKVDAVGNSTAAAASKMTTAARGASLYATNMRQVATANGLAGHQMGQLVAQLNDVGVSIASGQNPLLVLLQQGSQIQFLASTVEGGFRTLLKATASLIVGQQAATTAATRQAAANLAAATAAETAAAATAHQAAVAANLAITEQALATAQTAAGGAAARLAVAEAELAAAQAAVTATANASTAALTRLNAAKTAAAGASQAATIANAELASAQLASAQAATAAARAQQANAASTAGTVLRLGALGKAAAIAAVVLAPLAVGLYKINEQANADNGLNDYVRTLGLTADEIKELKDVTVTYGDTAKAVFQVIGKAIWDQIGPAVTRVWGHITDFFNSIFDIAKKVINGIIGAFVGAFRAIVVMWRRFPQAMGDLFFSAVNAAIDAINFLIRKSVEGINNFIRASNSILEKVGLDLPELQPAQISRVANQYAGAGREMGEAITGELSAAMNRDYLGEFGDAVAAQALQNARDRIGAQAAELIGDRPERRARTGGRRSGVDEEARAAERRAHALEQVNLQLDNELATMRLLGDAREIQQRMDQITESLAQKNITLTQQETAAIRAKVAEIVRFAHVQAEMDRIYERAVGPLRTYEAALEAITILQERGEISSARAAQEQVLANRAYQEAIDPLFSMKEAMDAQERTLGLYGDALEQANYYEQIRLQFLREGIVLSGTYVAGLNAEVDALMRRNAALTQQQYIQSQVGSFVDPALEQAKFIQNYQAIYDQIDLLRQTDLQNEAAYQQALYALQARYNEMRLSGVSDFFGALASVTSKGHGAIGAISKAAAVAQATIDGYVAVQKALASLPPPFNFAAAAAVAIKTGAQVAGILSTNVGSFATGGQFIVGGRSGVDKNNINMNVTKGERVTVETVRQQRANDNAPSGSGPTEVNVPVKVVAQFDPRMALDALDTAEGERLIISTVERNPQVFQRLMGSR